MTKCVLTKEKCPCASLTYAATMRDEWADACPIGAYLDSSRYVDHVYTIDLTCLYCGLKRFKGLTKDV